MTDSDTLTGEWKPIPGVQEWYQASHRGKIRSLDHDDRNGRPHRGIVLSPRTDGDGYLVVNITLSDGTRKHGMSVARLVLLAHAGEPPDPAMQACHGPGGQLDNRWPENLRWDTDQENRDDRWEAHPPKAKLKVCVLCGAEFGTPGRRCHACVVKISFAAACLIAEGKDTDEAAREVGYPSANGLFRLARKYGGLRCTIEPVVPVEEANAALREATRAGDSRSWLRRVTMGGRKRGDAP